MKLQEVLKRIAQDKSGATAIEYGLIVSLIVIAMLASLSSLGGGALGMWTNVANKTTAAMGD